MVSLSAALVSVAFLPTADVLGPGCWAENLVRPEFLLALLLCLLVVHYSTKYRARSVGGLPFDLRQASRRADLTDVSPVATNGQRTP